MVEKKEIYKCEICGNIVEVVHEGRGVLICCGQPMKLQKENTVDASQEKHVPIIRGKKVKVGSIAHPMVTEHYIEWIEATSETGETAKVFLKPDSKPEAEFSFKPVSAREYCNLHGLWKVKINKNN
ncbi:MAG: Superoxide reductase [Candidatus Diapherotrites archaeon ADurb.Bin253]|jgi:superoxide reductase|nr:desulfoferrodoxin [Candidatus Pacearchaeota archaeon]OQA68737.1 MAG: Superoxide reductase [Candidatus Diapherotrites archaeon ADurb.Bin253]HNZ52196.1 desulfoferrodoxin [Candidatus Pacearchaeota archaeon]HOF43985.1 desulfoferrodoxin [Candidatus Pacearchaeota archaeon]HOH04473.1 desulfoferrodoxin [Candidatus Pacearchaeota archaeon]